MATIKKDSFYQKMVDGYEKTFLSSFFHGHSNLTFKQMSEVLGISENSFYRKLKKYNLIDSRSRHKKIKNEIKRDIQ